MWVTTAMFNWVEHVALCMPFLIARVYRIPETDLLKGLITPYLNIISLVTMMQVNKAWNVWINKMLENTPLADDSCIWEHGTPLRQMIHFRHMTDAHCHLLPKCNLDLAIVAYKQGLRIDPQFMEEHNCPMSDCDSDNPAHKFWVNALLQCSSNQYEASTLGKMETIKYGIQKLLELGVSNKHIIWLYGEMLTKICMCGNLVMFEEGVKYADRVFLFARSSRYWKILLSAALTGGNCDIIRFCLESALGKHRWVFNNGYSLSDAQKDSVRDQLMELPMSKERDELLQML